MNILFTTDYGNGIGDFLVKIYGVCHLKKYITENVVCDKTTFIIEEEAQGILNKMLNIDFFNDFFNTFIIQNRYNYIQDFGKNTIYFDNKQYIKKFSAIGNLHNNSRGNWDLYSDIPFNIDIPFEIFSYQDISSRRSKPIPDYNLEIFNKKLVSLANKFVNENLMNGFDTIYYRTLGFLDQNHLAYTINKIQKYINPSKKYFITSNSEQAKQKLLNIIPNSIPYQVNSKNKDYFGKAIDDIDIVENLIVEMLIMSYGSNIIYGGNHVYISLFNYYPHMVKRIPLINCE